MNDVAIADRRSVLPPEWDGYAAFTVEEVCRIVRVGRTSAYKAVANGEIKSVRIGGRVLIPRIVVERMLTAA